MQLNLPIPICSQTSICPFVVRLGLLSSSSYLGIISSFTLIWTTILLSHRHNKVLSTTSLVVWGLKTRKYIPKRTCLFSSSHYFLFLPPTIHFANLLQCSRSLHHPLFGAAPTLHSTQTNKVANPCIPYSRNKMSFCRKRTKVDGHWQ